MQKCDLLIKGADVLINSGELKENVDICTVTLGDFGDKEFALRLINLGREKCVETYSRYFETATPKQIEFFYAFVSAGCIGLLQKWLAEGMVTSAEEIAEMAENIMMFGMGALKSGNIQKNFKEF